MRGGVDPRLDEFHQMLDEHERDCVTLARVHAERLMDERRKRRDEPNWQDRGGSLGLRVRERGEKGAASFRAEWIVMRRIPASTKDRALAKNNDSRAKFVTRYFALPKGRSDQYPNSRLLKYARPWEEELILEIESEVAHLRTQVKKIVDLRRRVNLYNIFLEGEE